MSQRPGIRNLPLPSMTRAPLGAWKSFELDTDATRLPLIRTVRSVSTEEVSGLMTVTWVIAIETGLDVCPKMDAQAASKARQKTRSAMNRNRIEKEYYGRLVRNRA